MTRTLLQRKKATLARASLKRCRCVRPLGWVIPSYSSLLFLFLFLIDRPLFGSIKRSGDLKLHIVFWFVSRGEKNRLSTSFLLLTTTDNEKKLDSFSSIFHHFDPELQAFPLIASSSVSKISVAPPGILGGEPIAPVFGGLGE